MSDLTAEKTSLSERVRDLERTNSAREEATAAMSGQQVQEALRRQMAALQTRLDSNMEGRQAESEMYEEAVVRAVHLEVTVKELEAKVRTVT